MDQDKFCDLGDVDDMETSGVDLTQPPISGEGYLRQVMVGRSKCEPIAVADRDFTYYESKRTSQIPAEFLKTVFHSDGSPSPSPPQSWRQQQIFEFERLRAQLSERRSEIVKKLASKIRFPTLNDESGWKKFCFEAGSSHFDASTISADEKNRELLKMHQGTPPLLSIMSSMSPAQAMNLFEFHVAWFIEEGYRPDRMHWFYALMLLIEKPLTPDVCSALRDLARELAKIRRLISADQKEDSATVLRACDLFLCLIIDYFGQKDLANW